MELFFEKLVQILNFLPPFLSDALFDAAKLFLPLFIIFWIIEIFESYFVQKITSFSKFSLRWGPLAGTLLAFIPQCGFSVIVTILYIKRFVSAGTLIAVYIATSDEAIPVLMVYPDKFTIVVKILLIKFVLALVAGYLTDFILNAKLKALPVDKKVEIDEKGCCDHEISHAKNLFWHPIKHTFNVFCFIFVVCAILNYFLARFGAENIGAHILQNSLWQPLLTGLFGLIPNCAVSVLITMMYIKQIISFGSVISGLSSGAGLGLLVLFKKNDNIKNSFLIVTILLIVSVSAGIILDMSKAI